MIVSTCGCRCARRDYVDAFDDIIRAMQQEEADADGMDRCSCSCHEIDWCHEDYDEPEA